MEIQESPLNKVLKVTLVILIIITVSFGGFILFSINKNASTKKVDTTNISPTAVVNKEKVSPTMSAVETDNPNNIDIGSVEADLKDIGTDVNSLQ